MRILVLASWYPSDEDRTYGIFIKEQAKALIKTGVDVRVFYPFDKSRASRIVVKTEEDGIITYRCNTDYMKSSKLSRINSAVKTVMELRRISKEYDFELIHCHVCYFAGIIGYIYKKLYGKKYLITEHMSYVDSYAEKLYNYILLKKAYRYAERVVCVSNYLAENLRNLGFIFDESIIGNVVDTSVFCSNDKRYFKDDFVNIVFIGSMLKDEVKGVSYLLKAFSLLCGLKTNCRLHLIGDGHLRDEYEKLALSLGIEHFCRFYGKLDRTHVAEILNSCSFFVLPSKHETFGTVIIEALSCGKPVVTTDIGGQSEIIKDSSLGYLVKSQDEYSLFHGLNSMAENFNNYDSEYLRYYAKSYSYENIGRKIQELYIDCLDS